jgi:hypothetical protein
VGEVNEQKKVKDFASMTQAELAAHDAEEEAEYQRVVAATKRPAKLKRDERHVGCPWGFLADVRSRTLNAAALVVGLYVFHAVIRNKSRTVKLVGGELAELRVDRSGRHKALRTLAAVGLIRLRQSPPGCATEVELIWRPEELLWRSGEVRRRAK